MAFRGASVANRRENVEAARTRSDLSDPIPIESQRLDRRFDHASPEAFLDQPVGLRRRAGAPSSHSDSRTTKPAVLVRST